MDTSLQTNKWGIEGRQLKAKAPEARGSMVSCRDDCEVGPGVHRVALESDGADHALPFPSPLAPDQPQWHCQHPPHQEVMQIK